MKKLAFVMFILIQAGFAMGQKYITKNGHIMFYSETPMETIEAHNTQVNSVLDITTGDFVFKVLMKSFEFEKALMQEHFNENYVESDKFPNAIFKGKVININDMDFSKAGEYNAVVEGELTLHGVTKKITEKGTFSSDGSKITGKSKFVILPGDYDIKIPKTVINNIAEEIEVTVEVALEPLK
jgi:polyisoprenoid-binding protein YceI